MIILIISQLNGYFWLQGPDKILLLSTEIKYSNKLKRYKYFSRIEEAQQSLYFSMNLKCRLARLWDNVLVTPSLSTVGVPLLRHLSSYGVVVGQGKLIFSFKRI